MHVYAPGGTKGSNVYKIAHSAVDEKTEMNWKLKKNGRGEWI
jgi:hypothetical protein